MILSTKSPGLSVTFISLLIALASSGLTGCKARRQSNGSLKTSPSADSGSAITAKLGQLERHLAVLEHELERIRGTDKHTAPIEASGQAGAPTEQVAPLQAASVLPAAALTGNVEQDFTNLTIGISLLAETLQKIPALTSNKAALDSLTGLSPLNSQLSDSMGIGLTQRTNPTQMALGDDGKAPNIDALIGEIKAIKSNVESLNRQADAERATAERKAEAERQAEIRQAEAQRLQQRRAEHSRELQQISDNMQYELRQAESYRQQSNAAIEDERDAVADWNEIIRWNNAGHTQVIRNGRTMSVQGIMNSAQRAIDSARAESSRYKNLRASALENAQSYQEQYQRAQRNYPQ